jgi:vancomycin resistance protein VanW
MSGTEERRLTGHVRRVGRMVAAPAVRRVRRQVQWWGCGTSLRLRRGEPEDFPEVVFRHATPTIRVLAGVEERLQRNKVTNLRLAVDRLDGLVLGPGQRFSFWWHVRKPSARRGFLGGVVLDAGRLTEGVGGGLCQLTNLLYWMTLHTPLTVVERWRHSHDVFPDVGRTQPFGSGATCAWPVLDLQLENRTDLKFRLALTVTDDELSGAWTADRPVLTGYEVYESDHLIVNTLPGVFERRNAIRRRVRNVAGELIDDEPVVQNRALMMYPPFLEPGSSGGTGPGGRT